MKEGWQICFFETTIVLMIFSLGLPAYIYQVVVPDELKRVVLRHKFLVIKAAALPALGYIILTLAFIWAREPSVVFLSGKLLMSSGILLTVLFWAVAHRKPAIESIILKLEDRVLRSIDWSARVRLGFLGDLIEVGKSFELRKEKGFVLDAMANIAFVAQGRSGYSGHTMQELIVGVEEIVFSSRGEDHEVLKKGATILSSIVVANKRRNLDGCSDSALAVRVAGRLGVLSVEKGDESAVLAFIEVASLDPRELYRIGTRALAKGSYLAAAACLNRLEIKTLKTASFRCRECESLLGLLAHFWKRGEAERQRVSQSLERLTDAGVDLREALAYSRESHRKIGEFETTNLLGSMSIEAIL